MKYDPKLHHRRSIRLKGYDYTQPGAYFITIVIHQRECLLGEIVNGEMHLSEFGEIAYQEWLKTAQLRSNIELNVDEFVIMPNHVHGIIWIVESRARRRRAPATPMVLERFGKPVPGSLATVIRGYKSAVTYRINALRNTRSCPLWQRNYYEAIIRNERELENIWKYIDANPANWKKDEYR